MAFGRSKTKQAGAEIGPVEISTIPESVLPGGEYAEDWQNAYADFLEAPDDDARDAAVARMEELGMETTTGNLTLG